MTIWVLSQYFSKELVNVSLPLLVIHVDIIFSHLTLTLYTISAWFYVELSTLERVILRGALNPRTRNFMWTAQSRTQGKMRHVALKHREETTYPRGGIVFIKCYVTVMAATTKKLNFHFSCREEKSFPVKLCKELKLWTVTILQREKMLVLSRLYFCFCHLYFLSFFIDRFLVLETKLTNTTIKRLKMLTKNWKI